MSPMADFAHGNVIGRDDGSPTTGTPGRKKAREGVEVEEISKAVQDMNIQDGNQELLELMRGLVGRLDRLEESQTELRKEVAVGVQERRVWEYHPMNPEGSSSLFESALGRGPRLHLNSLSGSPERYQGAVPHGYYAEQGQAGGPNVYHEPGPARRGVRGGFGYPDARQKELKLRPFDGTELYQGLGSGFLEWGRRFERQVVLDQSACGFYWSEDVKVDLLGHYLDGMAEKYFNKQIEAWWSQAPTLQFALERMLQAFKTNITLAQAMELFTRPKDPRKLWIEHLIYLNAVADASGGGSDYLVLNNIVQYASSNMKIVLMAKVDQRRNDYLQQAEKLAHFAQAWESGMVSKRTGMEVVNNVDDRQVQDTRKCFQCGEVGHMRINCPRHVSQACRDLDFVLAMPEVQDQQPENEAAVIIMETSKKKKSKKAKHDSQERRRKAEQDLGDAQNKWQQTVASITQEKDKTIAKLKAELVEERSTGVIKRLTENYASLEAETKAIRREAEKIIGEYLPYKDKARALSAELGAVQVELDVSKAEVKRLEGAVETVCQDTNGVFPELDSSHGLVDMRDIRTPRDEEVRKRNLWQLPLWLCLCLGFVNTTLGGVRGALFDLSDSQDGTGL